MKRLTFIVALSLLMCSLFGCHQSGRATYTYKAVAGGVALYRYKGNTTKPDLVIPDRADGANVVELMDFCAANAQYLKTVKIGANVEKISNWAFANCAVLETFEVDAQSRFFETDENGVLYTTGKKELVFYPNARVKLNKDAGEKVTGGGAYEVPASVTKIRDNAFYLCANLYTITFNEGLEEIGDAAFMKCSSLQNFVLPQSLTTIGRDGFSFCDSLTTVTIPSNVKKIGDFGFYSKASAIKKITVKRARNKIHCGDDWLPIMKNSGNVKAKVVYEP